MEGINAQQHMVNHVILTYSSIFYFTCIRTTKQVKHHCIQTKWMNGSKNKWQSKRLLMHSICSLSFEFLCETGLTNPRWFWKRLPPIPLWICPSSVDESHCTTPAVSSSSPFFLFGSSLSPFSEWQAALSSPWGRWRVLLHL